MSHQREAMEEERHTSPAGTITLIVERLPNENDFLIGFDGFPWHTHPALLGGAEATRTFIDDVLSDRLSVVVERTNGEISDVFVSFDPESEGDDPAQGVTVEVRRWSSL